MSEAETMVRSPKCAQVLEGARKVFAEQGFEGASVDEIARTAGTSKATLYCYFPDKKQLFEAVIQAECQKSGGADDLAIAPGELPETVLRRIAVATASSVLSPATLKMFRICIAEAARFPELGQAFFAAGPGRAREQMLAYLAAARERGELVIDDLEMAADQFSALCKTRLVFRALFGCKQRPSQDEIAYVADEAVRTFMARYGPRAA